MASNDLGNSERILILTPTRSDGAIAVEAFRREGIAGLLCEDIGHFSREFTQGAGAALIVEDQLTEQATARLNALLSAQPPWSDFPLLVLATRRRGRGQDDGLANLGNVTLLDPPLRIRTLLRAAHAALRGRRRQYQARHAIAERDRLLAMLGHELRNPLSAIALATEAIQLDSPTTPDPLPIINRQVQHLKRMVDDLLDVARVSSGKMALQCTNVDLSQLVEETVASFRPQLEAAGIACHLKVTRNLRVHGDSMRLEQVLGNLLTNALKYTACGGTVEVVLDTEKTHGLLSVKDTGEGIEPHVLPHIFGQFIQARSTLARAEGGIGVGLTLVKTLVELHHGAVCAESEGPGTGSRFTVELPLAAQPAPAENASSTAESRADANRKVVAVIEDNEDARLLLVDLLSRQGHRVLVAADGESGVHLLLDHHPDAAIVDLGLPKIDGYEVARQVRSARYHDMLLIALTGYGQAEDRQRALAAGFNAHLTKPASLGQISDLLGQGMITRVQGT